MKNISFHLGFSRSVSIVVALMLLSISPIFGDSPAVRSDVAKQKFPTPETGIASYYGTKYHGRQTANGEVFNMNELTAAHPRLAFGTRVKVTHLANNLSVTVRINDRGPFVNGRVIDLSQAAARELHMVQSGLAEVKIEIVE
jgi:rare lipoprotein A